MSKFFCGLFFGLLISKPLTAIFTAVDKSVGIALNRIEREEAEAAQKESEPSVKLAD